MGMPPQQLQQMMMAQQQPQQGPPQAPQGDPSAMMGGDPSQQPQDPSQGPLGPQQQQPQPMPQADPEKAMLGYLDFAIMESNIAKKLKKEQLEEIGTEISRGYDEDQRSREEWARSNEEGMKMALLLREKKTFPWPKASNVKFPLLATAAMQFSARAYPALVPSDGEIVKVKISQQNPQDQMYEAAQRVAAHMSYQILNTIPNWEEDMDKLLMNVAITGTCFKKTYHSSIDDCNHSCIVYPENFVINYHAKSVEQAYRKTEILKYTKNEVYEKVHNDEEFLDVDLSLPTNDNNNKSPLATGIVAPPVDRSTPYTFLACHTFWDLDKDGYEEPYIITIHKETKKVVRIIARWDLDGVKRSDDKKKIIKITPVEYFTAFPFIPNPDGSIYGLGFGLLLGPLNESVNTLINQLIDGGTLNNLQGGFIGKGLRLRMGDTTFQPGEWKVVNATGDDLSKSVFPLPTKEPSHVLLDLLNLLITSGNQLASIAEIFVGKMPGQNTPATTTQETIQQGMAVFTAIYKRVYRSLTSEFKKLYRLNRICPDIVEEESKIAGIQLQASDYDLEDWSIVPGADPVGDSSTVKMMKLQQVGQLISMGTINPAIFTKRMLEANEIPNAQELIMPPQQPPPDPKVQTEQVKQQTMQMGASIKQQESQQKMQLQEHQAAIDQAMKAMEIRHTEQLAALKEQGAQSELRQNQILQSIEQFFSAQKGSMEMQQAKDKHDQTMQHGAQAFAQKQQQSKATEAKRKKSKSK